MSVFERARARNATIFLLYQHRPPVGKWQKDATRVPAKGEKKTTLARNGSRMGAGMGARTSVSMNLRLAVSTCWPIFVYIYCSNVFGWMIVLVRCNVMFLILIGRYSIIEYNKSHIWDSPRMPEWELGVIVHKLG